MLKNRFPIIKRKYKIIVGLLAVFICYWIYLSAQEFEYPTKDEINKRLNYLERVINEPLDNNSEIVKLKYESSEFMLFTYAYSAYAFTNLIVRDSNYKSRLAPLIRECIEKSMAFVVSSQYGINKDALLSDSIPDYSVLYLGHLNMMIGCYRLVSDDASFNVLNDNISRSLYNRYNKSPFLCLESYSNAIWIPDNTVALASLKLHDVNTNSGYSEVCNRWVEYAKDNFLDADAEVLCSTVNSRTGEAEEESRGSMLGWSILFVSHFDKGFSLSLYENYKKYFSDNIGAFRFFRERSEQRFLGQSVIDSGPIILGYSIPANEFALGPAVLYGDLKTAKRIERLINIGTKAIDQDGELRYKVRFLDLNVSPMAEALVLNSLTAIDWSN